MSVLRLLNLAVMILMASNGRAIAAVGEPQLLSRSVGRVSEHFVTSREVRMNYWVEQVLYAKKDRKVVDLSADLGSPTFKREVNSVLLEWVLHLEAENFQVARPDGADVDQAVERVTGALKKTPSLKVLEPSSQELRALVGRKLQAKKFLQFKVSSSVLPVTDEEARSYFGREENRARFGQLPFERFKESIKTYLSRQQVDRRLKDWFDVLQGKYKVRNDLLE